MIHFVAVLVQGRTRTASGRITARKTYPQATGHESRRNSHRFSGRTIGKMIGLPSLTSTVASQTPAMQVKTAGHGARSLVSRVGFSRMARLWFPKLGSASPPSEREPEQS